ncbi:MAG: response regulator [Candidatus Methylophosphatis roskildensis]
MTEPPPTATESDLPRLVARVLLVEDDHVNVEVARAVLEPSGLTVSVAMSGSEAVAASIAERFDLILMDLQLPDFDGFEAARQIRAGETPGRRTPIVAMSGTIGPDTPRRCSEAGIDGFEEKPLTSELLARLASRCLADRGQARRRAPEILSVERLAALFRESAARLIGDLQRAHASADRDGVMRAAHTLKSISARVPADLLNGVCAQLEAAAGDGQPGDLAPSIAAVLDAYAALDPSLRAEPVEAPREEHVTAPAAQSAPRVLVVDDDENERFLVRRMLEQAGYRVDECDSGQAAIACCRDRRPDVVLLDGVMPGMDGIATCRALRTVFPPGSLAILMFTGLDDPDWRARAMQAGANGFVGKSVGVGELNGNLRAALIGCGLDERD